MLQVLSKAGIGNTKTLSHVVLLRAQDIPHQGSAIPGQSSHRRRRRRFERSNGTDASDSDRRRCLGGQYSRSETQAVQGNWCVINPVADLQVTYAVNYMQVNAMASWLTADR